MKKKKVSQKITLNEFSFYPHPIPTVKRIKMKIYPIKITFSFSENGSFIFFGVKKISFSTIKQFEIVYE
jgi:hypothetical protein